MGKVIDRGTIRIRKGVKVLNDQSAIVELQGDVIVDAVRESDGSWIYSIGKTAYCCCGGLAEKLRVVTLASGESFMMAGAV